MTDDELRALVRESIGKQLGAHPAPPRPVPPATHPHHASHALYLIPRDDEAGPCVIEPDVPCTHCNYCKSHGH